MNTPELSRPAGLWKKGAAVHGAVLAVGIAILGFFFANVEIQIEGSSGWAASLPTWRIEDHPLLHVFWGGRPMTGYHFWVFSFMALVFHFPHLLNGRFSLRTEARILGSIMIFWIVEDFLWFAMNPGFGVARLTPANVPWHKCWILGVPSDYVTFTAVGAALIVLSFLDIRRQPAIRTSEGRMP